MYTLLLAILYAAFISLGLPDALLGSAWPIIQQDFALPLSFAGLLTIIISAGTVVSSLCADRLTKRFGTGWVTFFSVATTAVALLGFSVAPSFWVLCLFALPYGLGAGAVDASINNFVALHYSARHMSWLHCFWGVGASIGPYIMGYAIAGSLGWSGGYRIIGVLQVVLSLVLLLSLPLWHKQENVLSQTHVSHTALPLSRVCKLPGVPLILITFFCYCAIETTTGMWATSFLHLHHGIAEEIAASYAAYFYLGITVGRFLCGLIADFLGDRQLIRLGTCVILLGILGLFHPTFCLVALAIIGMGCAPIYPAIIHSTPANFGAEHSQAIIGIQMASAYMGTILAPALFGLVADWTSISLYPLYLLGLATGILLLSECFNRNIPLNQISQ